MLENALNEFFEHSSDAVFGIDANGIIRYANANYEKLMGYKHGRICNAWCAEIMCGTNLHGQPFCGDDCPIPKALDQDQGASDFDLVVQRGDGERMLVNIGASYVPPHLNAQCDQVSVFFSVRKVSPQQLLQRMASAPLEQSGRTATGLHLTSRENEILGLATQGLNTAAIADTLSISAQTIRSHFKNIYQKLQVNSRTEAVIYALRNGLH